MRLATADVNALQASSTLSTYCLRPKAKDLGITRAVVVVVVVLVVVVLVVVVLIVVVLVVLVVLVLVVLVLVVLDIVVLIFNFVVTYLGTYCSFLRGL